MSATNKGTIMKNGSGINPFVIAVVSQQLVGPVEKEDFVGFGFGFIFCIGSGLWSCCVSISSLLQEGGRDARSACIRSEGQDEHRLGVVRRRGPLPPSDRPRPRPVVHPGTDSCALCRWQGSTVDRSRSLLPHAAGGVLQR